MCFVDDLTSHGKSFTAYVKWQRMMLAALREHRWKINGDKLHLGFREIKLLGHIVGNGNLRADPSKLEAVRKLRAPTT